MLKFLVFLYGVNVSLVLAEGLPESFQTKGQLQIQGELVQGGILRGWLPPNSQLELDGQPVLQNSSGAFVIGFGRDAPEQAVLSWNESGDRLNQTLDIMQRSYAVQYVEGVPQKTVTPDKSKLERIRKETALVKEARAQLFENDYFLDTFLKPLDGPKTGVYGSQRVYNGVPKRPHYGVDYAAPTGTLVYAPADAIVTLAHQDMFYSGGTLIMDHGYGLSSTFIHLSDVLVEEGEVIKAGQAVGKVGAGGRATGPHLDWRMNWFEVRLDPEKIMGLDFSKVLEKTNPDGGER